MQGINLSRRPFVNRRPVLRLAILLWIVGAGLLIHNFRQFTGHWQGSAKHRDDFANLANQVAEERKEFSEVQKGLNKVSVRRENQHTGFLNQLIAYRTFPWSALFDDLEDVVPLNVKLVSVRPDVHLKAVPKKPRRQQRRRPRPTTASRSESSDADSEDSPTNERTRSSDSAEPLRRDEVALQLAAVAKNEDAVVEFIERLYEDSSFRSPFLPGELIEQGGTVKFTLSTVYLTGQREVVPEAKELPTGAETIAAQPSETQASDLEVVENGEDALTPAGDLEETSSSTSLATTGSGAAPPASSATPPAPASRNTATNRTETRAREPQTSDGRAQRRERSAVPRSRIRPRPLTGGRPSGATGSGGIGSGETGTDSSGTTRPGTGQAGSADPPGFTDPPASAPPRLRRSSLAGKSMPEEART